MFLKYFLFIIIFFATTLKACEKPTMPSQDDWNNWLQEVRKEALDIGISHKSVNFYLSDVKPQKKIILRDRCQPESTITLKEYLYFESTNQELLQVKICLKTMMIYY